MAPPSGHFDIYLLAQSWAPLFCCTAPNKCTTVPWSASASHLSLHGLWPTYLVPNAEKHVSPFFCKTKFSPTQADVPKVAVELAPSYVVDLWKHEWKKHGSCSGMDPKTYFEEALRAQSMLPGSGGTPKIISQNVGGVISQKQLRGSYKKRVGIQADQLCRLKEVTTCWAKGPDGKVGEQVDCPLHVMTGGRNHSPCEFLKIVQLGQCDPRDRKTKKR